MDSGFLYVRGVGGSLFWSRTDTTGFLSHRDLEPIDLSRLSPGGTGTQAIVSAARCARCGLLAFQTTPPGRA